MPQLDPTWYASQLFWLVVTFSMLYYVLSRMALPPVQDIMARRERAIEADVQHAERFKSQADQAKQEYENALVDAKLRAQQSMTDAALQNKANAERKSKEMDAQIASTLAEASQRIQAKKQEMMQSLTPATVELTTLIVDKLIHTAPSQEKVRSALNTLHKERS